MRELAVVVADDSYLVREGVRQLLELEPGIRVVAGVGSGTELLDAVARQRVDAVVTDVRMPPSGGMEGIEAAHEIRRRHPGTAVVVLSAYADERYALELFRDGVDRLAYLVKDRVGDRAELVRAIRTTVDGGSVVDPIVVEAMARKRRGGRLDALSPREREVLERMATGASNQAIADAMFLSVSGVEKHITAVFGKLGLGAESAVHRRVAAVLAYLAGQ